MTGGKAPEPTEGARRSSRLMYGAGCMFMLAGAIPVGVDLVRGGDLSSVNATFVAIGAAFIAIGASTARKGGSDGDRSGEGPR